MPDVRNAWRDSFSILLHSLIGVNGTWLNIKVFVVAVNALRLLWSLVVLCFCAHLRLQQYNYCCANCIILCLSVWCTNVINAWWMLSSFGLERLVVEFTVSSTKERTRYPHQLGQYNRWCQSTSQSNCNRVGEGLQVLLLYGGDRAVLP